ncbi:hypothetical protein F5X68DRAFT_276936 [Plectosphaerella plurivora]|uniref:Uncharacterized protein n=1 Tax=Plectosphaerella plurivora TaxID=936078 RepID=A0A9P8V8S2_9PEZI|nr:hypothetical protein F5X68DRAFT_276936 [Plectosphaerella plurivora]
MPYPGHYQAEYGNPRRLRLVVLALPSGSPRPLESSKRDLAIRNSPSWEEQMLEHQKFSSKTARSSRPRQERRNPPKHQSPSSNTSTTEAINAASRSAQQAVASASQSAAEAVRQAQESIRRADESARQAIAQATRDASEAARQARESADQAIAQASRGADDRVRQANQSAQQAAQAAQESARREIDRSFSLVQAARADATAVRQEAVLQVQDAQGSALTTTQIALAVTASVAGISILSVIAFWLVMRRRKAKAHEAEQQAAAGAVAYVPEPRKSDDSGSVYSRQTEWKDGRSVTGDLDSWLRQTRNDTSVYGGARGRVAGSVGGTTVRSTNWPLRQSKGPSR